MRGEFEFSVCFSSNVMEFVCDFTGSTSKMIIDKTVKKSFNFIFEFFFLKKKEMHTQTLIQRKKIGRTTKKRLQGKKKIG